MEQIKLGCTGEEAGWRRRKEGDRASPQSAVAMKMMVPQGPTGIEDEMQLLSHWRLLLN